MSIKRRDKKGLNGCLSGVVEITHPRRNALLKRWRRCDFSLPALSMQIFYSENHTSHMTCMRFVEDSFKNWKTCLTMTGVFADDDKSIHFKLSNCNIQTKISRSNEMSRIYFCRVIKILKSIFSQSLSG